MSTFTWTAAASADWNTAGNWNPQTVPNGTTAVALLPGAVSGYTVTIAIGESETVNAIILGDLSGSHVGSTLDVAGTLSFAGSSPRGNFFSGALLVESTGELEGGALLPASFGVGTGFSFVNNGTVLADTGSFDFAAQSGFVGNLANGTLTGGTWIASGFFPPGQTFGSFNLISFGSSPQADIVTDDAVLTLDGPLGDIGDSASGFQSISQTLGTVGANGQLNLLDRHDYKGNIPLLDQGAINLGGATLATGGLTIAATGTLNGFGVVPDNITNDGGIIANGGALVLGNAVGGTGNMGTTAGSTLILNGATPSELNNNGTVYAVSGLLEVEGLLGGNGGTLVVQNGATLEFASGTTQTVKFSGNNATLKLDNYAGYLGALSGFSQGDSIVLAGTSATSAFFSASTLVVMHNTSTVDTIALAGSYAPGATFGVSNAGGAAIITNLTGAPLRQDFQFSISMDDTAGLSAGQEDDIVNDLSAAALDWAQYLTGHTTLRIQLDIVPGSSGAELAHAGATSDMSSGTTLDGRQLDIPSSLAALNTGIYDPGLSSDITVTFLAGNIGSIYVNPTPTPTPSGSVPTGEFDLTTTFRHELAHGFGFGGLTTTSGSLGSQETLFDHYIQTISGTVVFTGPNAEAQYGVLLGTDVPTPVPLTTVVTNEAYAHFANSHSDPNGDDLMSGLGLPPATQRDISPMDLAVLKDIGAPVTAVPCFVSGTLIRTFRGDVPVESLAVGDSVLTVQHRAQPIVWLGHRTVDCARHPSPHKVWPVRVAAGAFGAGLPARHLWLSPDHAIYLFGVLIPVKHLINDTSITQVPLASVTYHHVELPHHAVLLAENLPAESYLDVGDRANFANGGMPLTLHPDFASRALECQACAPVVVTGPELEAARRLSLLAGREPRVREPAHNERPRLSFMPMR